MRYSLLALGFRPFYLLAGAFAAFAVAYRSIQYSGWVPKVDPLWHAHEMVFGFAFAVMAGFLFTAVRNWTGRETPKGGALAAVCALWISARIAAFHSLAAAAALDLAFALAVAWGIGRPLVASGNRRNLFFVALVLLVGAASPLFVRDPALAIRVGLGALLVAMAVIGGRVIPMFTNNAIPRAGAARHARLEAAALASLPLLIGLDIAGLEHAATAVAFVAAALHAARLALWRPWKTLGKPILWILHISYAWLVAHLALRGLAGLGLVGAALATHALTVGAIGGLTLGMMTRSALGHTGRRLVSGPAETSAYVLVQAAAISRVVLPLLYPEGYLGFVVLAAAFWIAAFVVFTVAYAPILARARVDGLPG